MYNIEQIKITLNTNIPEKKPLPFTSSLLYSKELEKSKIPLEEYPYFTLDVLYPDSLFYLNYPERVSFFFVKDKFIEYLRKYTDFGKGAIYDLEEEGQTKEQKDLSEKRKDIELKAIDDDEAQMVNKINTIDKKTLTTDIVQKLYKDEALLYDELNIFREKNDTKIKEIEEFLKDKNKDTYTKEEWKEKEQDKYNLIRDLNKVIFKDDFKDSELKKIVDDMTTTPSIWTFTLNKNIMNIIQTYFEKKRKEKSNTIKKQLIDRIQPRFNVKKNDVIKKYTALTIAKTGTQSNKATPSDINITIGKNIMMMLQLLFPTNYPISNNIFSSFEKKIIKKDTFQVQWKDLIPGFLNSYIDLGLNKYSYLKIDGKIYTITQVIWLNDIYNNSDYANLVEKYRKLNLWKKKEQERLVIEIGKKINKFKETFNGGIYEFTDDPADETKDIQIITKEKNKYSTNTNNISVGSISTSEIINNIDDIITNIQKLNKELNEPNISTSILSDIAFAIESAYNKVSSKLSLPQGLSKKFAELIKQTNTIRVSEAILGKYIGSAGLILNYSDEDPKVKDELTSKYKEYTGFAETIREFVRPKKESTNLYLQDAFEGFLDNTDPTKAFINMMNPYKVESSDIEKKNRLNTGISISENGTPKYEMMIQLDVIGGELTNDNKKSIDCLFQGENLGKKLYNILEQSTNSWEIDKKHLLFLDIPAKGMKATLPVIQTTATNPEKKPGEEEKIEKENGEEGQQGQQEEGNPLNKEIKAGGYSKKKDAFTRRIKMFLLKTRKNYH